MSGGNEEDIPHHLGWREEVLCTRKKGGDARDTYLRLWLSLTGKRRDGYGKEDNEEGRKKKIYETWKTQ